MSKTRQRRFPDGPVWIRTEPVTVSFAHSPAEHAHDWHQLTYAAQGQLEVETKQVRALVPPLCAIQLRAGLRHREILWPNVKVRTLYVARGAMPRWPKEPRTVAISPLLREVILHASTFGALDRRKAQQARLIGVLIDLISAAPEVPLQLPTPRDPRARRLAELIEATISEPSPLSALAARAGGSLRTLERLFAADTGVSAGEWRRQFRLFQALRLLEGGASVTAVALEVGYSSTSAFIAAFRRQFKTTPLRRRIAGREAK